MLEFTPNSCSSITLANARNVVVIVNIFALNADNVFTSINQSQILAPSGSYTWELPDGEYTIQEVQQSNSELLLTYKWLVYCAVKACFIRHLSNLYCSDTDPCGCNDTNYNLVHEYKFVSLMVFIWAYLALLNKIYTDNWTFNVLPESEAADMVTLKGIREKITLHCKTC